MGSLGSPTEIQKDVTKQSLQYSAEDLQNVPDTETKCNTDMLAKVSEDQRTSTRNNSSKINHDVESSNTDEKLPRRRSSVWLVVKRKASVIPKGASPLDWKLIFLIFMSLFCSASSLTFLFPFLPEMVLSFGYEEVDKGYYAGLIASGVFAGRAFGSYFWGWLSDKIGRRPVLIMTVFGNGLFSLIFGFTYNLPMAIITRFLTGLANGTVGTAKTILYEICDDSNQAVGMSILSMSWGAGLILGPTAGGLLASPSRRYPDTFTESGLFGRFPYLLPSLIIFITCTAISVLTFFLLPETLNRKTKEEELEVIREEDEDIVADQKGESDHLTEINKEDHTILIHSQSNLHVISPKIAMSVENLHCESDAAAYRVQLERQASFHSDRMETSSLLKKRIKSNEEDFDSQYTGSNCVIYVSQKSLNSKSHTIRVEEIDNGSSSDTKETNTSTCWNRFINTSLIKLFRMADVRQAVLLYSAFSFGVVGYEEIFTVWASTEPKFDGLGFDPETIGTLLGITCIPLLVLNLYLFPSLTKVFGLRKTFIGCSVLLFILLTITPVLHLLYDQNTLLLGMLCLLLIPLKIITSCCFSATSLFVNNSSPPEMAGAVNGLAMTSTAIARSFAPAFGGSVFAWSIGYGAQNLHTPFDVNLSFFVFGLFVWGTTIYGVFINENLDRQKKTTK